MIWTTAILCLDLTSRLILDCTQNCANGTALIQHWFHSEEEMFLKSLDDGSYFSKKIGEAKQDFQNQTFSDFYSNLWDVYAKDHQVNGTMPKIQFNDSVHNFSALEQNNDSLIFYLEVQNVTDLSSEYFFKDEDDEWSSVEQDTESNESGTEPRRPRRRKRPRRRHRFRTHKLPHRSFRFRSKLTPKTRRKLDSKRSRRISRNRQPHAFVKYKSRLTPPRSQRRFGLEGRKDETPNEGRSIDLASDRRDTGIKNIITSFFPAFLTISSLLGFGVGTLFGDDENSITFNPTISYAGDNITFTVTDTDTITNGNEQRQTASATNDITNTDNNVIQTSIIPIVINTDGTVTVMGPINGIGRSFADHLTGDAKYRVINRREFAYGTLPTDALNRITDFFGVPVEFFNDVSDTNSNDDEAEELDPRSQSNQSGPMRHIVNAVQTYVFG
ncbi:uncharacterized protein LOC131886379 [Tigriopus californicus]|uniref:uncharacterized protein LOC131886379 n=1 Tax=Tigriopus californicus TaxID=6832 RepID=UPI0027D9E149|nr:uncharacterized protein LOC131886379 [Tigriopus californicus]